MSTLIGPKGDFQNRPTPQAYCKPLNVIESRARNELPASKNTLPRNPSASSIGKSDLLAKQQLLAAAHLFHSERLSELIEQGDLRAQRIDFIAAHLALTVESARKKALEQRQVAAIAGFQRGTIAQRERGRVNPFAKPRILDERKEPVAVQDALDERCAAQPGELQVEALDRTAARVPRVVDREAAESRAGTSETRLVPLAF